MITVRLTRLVERHNAQHEDRGVIEVRDTTGPEAKTATTSQPAYRNARLLRRSKGLHKLMYNRLGLPLGTSEGLIRGMKYFWNRDDAQHRKRIARGLKIEDRDHILQSTGILRFDPEMLHGACDVVDACRAAFDTAQSTGVAEAAQASGRKGFLVSIVKNEQALHHKCIIDLALSRSVIDTASKYLGAVPVLSAMRLWWTPPNISTAGSQMYHCDREDRKQLKFLTYITDSTTETGPLTVLPADISETVKTRINYSYKRYRRTDAEILEAGGDEPVTLTGPSGTMYCVDTSRCLHFGARQNSAPRLLLMLQYTDSLAPNVTVPSWRPGAQHPSYELDELQRLVLGLARA